MEGIKDIHCHILFGVDDGARDIEESIKLLIQEFNQGVRDVIVTPHYDVGGCMPNPNIVLDNFEQLKERAKKETPNLNIYLGSEIFACNDMIKLLENNELNSLAESQYVLIEFFPTVQYSEIEKYANLILNNGYRPIIAHCERYSCLHDRLRTINETNIKHLVDMGAYMQVNCNSVTNKNAKFVKKLINKDLLHLIASDAHNMSNRGVHWEKCVQALIKKYNKDYIKWILIDNPQKVIKNIYI